LIDTFSHHEDAKNTKHTKTKEYFLYHVLHRDLRALRAFVINRR